jgi:hypothetical protein
MRLLFGEENWDYLVDRMHRVLVVSLGISNKNTPWSSNYLQEDVQVALLDIERILLNTNGWSGYNSQEMGIEYPTTGELFMTLVSDRVREAERILGRNN